MTSQLDSPHPLNRHMVIADNLELLRAMDNETVDLIVTDPPFAKNYAFTGKLTPPERRRAGTEETDPGRLGNSQPRRGRQGEHRMARQWRCDRPVLRHLNLGERHP